MAKDIIEKIRDCEKQASEIIANAEQQAQQIIDKATAEAKTRSKQNLADADVKAKSMIATAENNAYKVKMKAFEENDNFAAEQKEAASKNLPDATNLIIKEIIPE